MWDSTGVVVDGKIGVTSSCSVRGVVVVDGSEYVGGWKCVVVDDSECVRMDGG